MVSSSNITLGLVGVTVFSAGQRKNLVGICVSPSGFLDQWKVTEVVITTGAKREETVHGKVRETRSGGQSICPDP